MDSSGLTPLQLSQKQVVKMPMDQLWTDAELLPAIRKENLITAQVRDLLRKGPIQFVIANCGDKLVWVPINTCYDFFKSELSTHLVDNPDYIYLDEYKGAYAYSASRWICPSFPVIVLLEKLH